MSSGGRAARRAFLFTERPSIDTICPQCRIHLRRASTATAVAPPTTVGTSPIPSDPPKPKQAYRILASVILSRPPQLTRELHPFEKAYYLYQRRLNERLALPFTRYFYYKKGTPEDGDWKRKVRARLTPSRDVGRYDAYGDEAWNDEVLVGDRTGEPDSIVDEVLRDANADFDTPAVEARAGQETPRTAEQAGEGEEASKEAGSVPQDEFSALAKQKREKATRPHPRETEADRTGDKKSLSRKMDRALYLLVRDGTGHWKFPAAVIKSREGLHQAAERVLVQAGGINMNTWVVGHAPIAWHQIDFSKTVMNKDRDREEVGEKTFFMKARIMAGQADLTKNVLGDQDFSWLTREEVQERVHPKYFSSIRNVLVER